MKKNKFDFLEVHKNKTYVLQTTKFLISVVCWFILYHNAKHMCNNI